MGKLIEIIKKNAKNYFRFKSNFALLVLFPIAIVLLFFLLNGHPTVTHLGIVNSQIQDSDYLQLHKYSVYDDCKKDLLYGKIQGCYDGLKIEYSNDDPINLLLLKEYTNVSVFSPVFNVEIKHLVASKFMIIVLMFLAIFFSSSNLVAEINSKTFMRNKLTGTSNFTFLLGRLLSSLFLLVILFVIIFAIFGSFIRVGLLTNPLFYVVVLFIMILFTLVGLFIGYLTSNYQNVAILSLLLSLVFYVFSFEFISRQWIFSYDFLHYINPFTISNKLLRDLILFNSLNSNVLLVLIGYIVVLYFIVWTFMSIFSTRAMSSRKRQLE